jgi:apolipoprotein N-acyltransferase
MFLEHSPFRSTFFCALWPTATAADFSQFVERSAAFEGPQLPQAPIRGADALKPPIRNNRYLAGLARAVFVVAIGLLTATPWLAPKLVWCGWLGAAGALWLATTAGRWGVLSAWAWSLLAICLAFHWAPATLAYSMKSSDQVGLLVAMVLATWESFRAMLPFWLAGKITKNLATVWAPAAALTVLVETLIPSVFPWKFGYAQIDWLWTVQAVDVFGPEWSSFMYFAHAGAVLTVICTAQRATDERRHVGSALGYSLRTLGCSLVVWLCLANLAYGAGAEAYWRQRPANLPSLRVALVQVDPSFKDSAERMRTLTRPVADQVDLVCWPESSGGSYDFALDRLSDEKRVFALSRDPNRGLRPWENPQTPLLLGAKTYSGHRDRPKVLYQSAILLDKSEQIVGRYHKRDLMPFGEYVPGQNWAPGMNELFTIRDPVARGAEATVLPCGEAKLGVMLCYEDMLPETARSLVNNSANLLISLINGSAFESRLTLDQHRRLAQLRAVECRRYFLRCAATGETCLIAPTGEIEARLPLEEPGVLTVKARLIDESTWYCRLGRFFPVACGLAIGLYLAPSLPRRLRTSQQSENETERQPPASQP